MFTAQGGHIGKNRVRCDRVACCLHCLCMKHLSLMLLCANKNSEVARGHPEYWGLSNQWQISGQGVSLFRARSLPVSHGPSKSRVLGWHGGWCTNWQSTLLTFLTLQPMIELSTPSARDMQTIMPATNVTQDSRIQPSLPTNLHCVCERFCDPPRPCLPIDSLRISKIPSSYSKAFIVSSFVVCTVSSTWGWHFRMLFRTSKLKTRRSVLPRFIEKRPSSFELWALKLLSKMSPQMGLVMLSLFLWVFVLFDQAFCWKFLDSQNQQRTLCRSRLLLFFESHFFVKQFCTKKLSKKGISEAANLRFKQTSEFDY